MTYDPSAYALGMARLKEQVRARHALSDRLSAIGYERYLDNVVINSAPEPQKFAALAEGWQWDQARAIGPAVEAVCRVRTGYRGKRFFWRTMPRGHDKSSSVGRLMNWALAYTRRQFSAVVAASDREQASYITEFMRNEADLNPWLKARLAFKIGRVEGRNGAYLKVLAADQFGTFGLSNDIMIFEELTHWASSGLWDTLTSGMTKRPGAVLFVITNAGVQGSWQWDARENARRSPLWDFYEPARPLARWMAGPAFDEMLRMLPPAVASRVIFNRWANPAEDCGFLTRAEVDACARRGVDEGRVEVTRGAPDTDYVAGIDYGPRKDRTVMCLGHREGDSFVVDHMTVLRGKDFPGREVPVAEVEAWVERTRKAFPRITYVVDPHQLLGTIQKFQGVTTIERFEPRAGKSNYQMAQTLRSAVVNRRVCWYPGCGDLIEPNDGGVLRVHSLADELAALVIQTTAAGYRLNHLPNAHDDRACALGMCCWRALGGFRPRPFVWRDGYF